MRCRKVSAKLAFYSAGALNRRQTALVERHLSGCAGCAREWASFNDVMFAVNAVEPLSPPAGLWESVAARIEDRARQDAQAPATIRCERVVADLPAYSAGAIRERQMAQIEDHLRACSECAREWDDFQSVMRMVEGIEEKSPPLFLWEKVRDTVTATAQPQRRVGWHLPKVVPAFAGGMALAAVLALAAVKLHPRQPGAPIFEPMGKNHVASNLDFVQQHAAMAQNELFADRAALGTLVNYVPGQRR